MGCKECHNKNECIAMCDQLKDELASLQTSKGDLLYQRHRLVSLENERDLTLDMQMANDMLIALENQGVRPLDDVTQLPPCLRLKELRKLGYDI